MLRNLSTGTEASATGESLNSGDVAVHPAARHSGYATFFIFVGRNLIIRNTAMGWVVGWFIAWVMK